MLGANKKTVLLYSVSAVVTLLAMMSTACSERLNRLDSASRNNDGHLDVAEGTVIAVYELSPLTLEPNGHVFLDTIDNGEGRFAFENILLGSPYVLIEIQDSCIAFDCQQRGVWGSSSYQTHIEIPCDYDALIAEDSSWAASLPSRCLVLDSTKYPVSLSAIIDVRNYQEPGSSKISINTLSYLMFSRVSSVQYVSAMRSKI